MAKHTHICTAPGCTRKITSKNLCTRHYEQLRVKNNPICKIDGCTSPAKTKRSGLCPKHTWRLKSNGDPTIIQVSPKGTSLKIVLGAVGTASSECIPIPVATKHPIVRYQGKPWPAQRLSRYLYDTKHNTLPIDWSTARLQYTDGCIGGKCVNPHHLIWNTPTGREDRRPRCTHRGCELPTVSRSLCASHYSRYLQSIAPVCQEPDCNDPSVVKGYCDKHYRQHRINTNGICTAPGCDERAASPLQSHCRKHQWRLDHHGSLEPAYTKDHEPYKLAVSVAEGPYISGCFEWPFSKTNGYGNLRVDGKMEYAHRLVKYLVDKKKGILPDNWEQLDIAHMPIGCHNPACINPAHLRWATEYENALDVSIDESNIRIEDVWRIKEGTLGLVEFGLKFNLTEEIYQHIKHSTAWDLLEYAGKP